MGAEQATATLAPRRRPRPWRPSSVLAAALNWKTFSIGLIIFAIFVIFTIFAPFIAPYDPNKVDYASALQSPSGAHLFGTDDHGRDILSRVIYGTRVSFIVAGLSVALASLIGLPAGLIAGYFGGWIDTITSRLVDAMFAFPGILLAIAVLAVLGPGERSVLIAIGLVSIPNFARVARSAMIAEKENEYVVAERVVGASWRWIIFRAILPNTLGPVLVLVSLGFAFAILNETALSFLGLGAQPPTASWGEELANGRRYLIQAPWFSFFPGIAIFLLVLALNLAGDGLRDLMDPRRRHS